MDTNALSSLEQLLNQGGWNYRVFLRMYSSGLHPGESSSDLIARSLGKQAVVGGIQAVTTSEVIFEVDNAIMYLGDKDAGPDPAALRSDRFKQLQAQVKSDLQKVMENATSIEQFWLREGHPAYPVWWDFAFLISGQTSAVIFIGSSSD